MRDRRRSGTDWLSPEAYNSLSNEEKLALAARRSLQRKERFQHPRPGRRKPRRSVGGYVRYQAKIILGAIAAIFVVGWLSDSGLSLPNEPTKIASITESFGYCKWGGGTNCVVDGDTFYLAGQKIRIADIDAPETHDYRCPSELELGNRASDRLHTLLNSGAISMSGIGRDRDVYGRLLRNVAVNGQDVGETLIDEGLAHRYVSGKLPWC
jgi:endonuclease YncB( thermonuclease family)